MPAFSIRKAREGKHITDKELKRFGVLERFGVLFMICQDQIKISSEQFAQAAADFGGTGGSFAFAYRHAIKELKENNCYVDPPAKNSGGEIRSHTITKEVPDFKFSDFKLKRKGSNTKRKASDDSEDELNCPRKKKGRGGYNGVVKVEEKDEDESEDEDVSESV